jgi:CelD/BcsL family acetyltransferase involved in cellulose biosynthesis
MLAPLAADSRTEMSLTNAAKLAFICILTGTRHGRNGRREAAGVAIPQRANAATFINLIQPILNASLLKLPPPYCRAPSGAEVVVASIGSEYAPRVAIERTVSAIASARRALLANRYAVNSLAVEWRWFADLMPVVDEWRDLAGRALEPNVFYEPSFALAAAAVFGHDVGAVLVWSATQPRKLLGFFPARVTQRRYGLKLPVLVGWTHPYAPLGLPLVERDAAEPVITAWFAHLAGNSALPGLLLLPLMTEDGPFAAALGAVLRRARMPCADFARHRRALLAPGEDRSHYLDRALSLHRQKELRRTVRRLTEVGAVLFSAATEPAVLGKEIEDFFALEASGWKGEAGTAAARHVETRSFIKSVVASLGAEGKAAIHRIVLDGRAIAAAITLRSGDGAWYWKTAYDERFARYAPGMLLSAALTEELAEDAAVARTDSCAAPGTAVLDPMWRERLPLCDRLIAVRPEAKFSRACRLETLRGAAVAAVKSIRGRWRRQR